MNLNVSDSVPRRVELIRSHTFCDGGAVLPARIPSGEEEEEEEGSVYCSGARRCSVVAAACGRTRAVAQETLLKVTPVTSGARSPSSMNLSSLKHAHTQTVFEASTSLFAIEKC